MNNRSVIARIDPPPTEPCALECEERGWRGQSQERGSPAFPKVSSSISIFIRNTSKYGHSKVKILLINYQIILKTCFFRPITNFPLTVPYEIPARVAM